MKISSLNKEEDKMLKLLGFEFVMSANRDKK